MLIVNVPADDIFNPGDVGGGASEDGRLLIHNTSDRTKAGYTMNLPTCPWVILAHQRTARISLSNIKITISIVSSSMCENITLTISVFLIDRPDKQTSARRAGYNHSRS